MRPWPVFMAEAIFDGGKLPIEENIAITRTVVRAAHAMGAGVEAELAPSPPLIPGVVRALSPVAA